MTKATSMAFVATLFVTIGVALDRLIPWAIHLALSVH